MAENAAVPVDDQSSLHDAHNALVYRDAGNSNYPAKITWRNDSADYILDADNAAGNHINIGSGDFIVQNTGVTIGVPLTVTDLLATGNLAWKSGTAFKITLDHAATADRVVTVQDATQTLVGRDTTDTLTSKTLTSPTINAGALSGTFSGNHTLSGGVTLSSAGTALLVNNNATIQGTLTTVAIAASGQISTTVAGLGLSVTNNATIGGTLGVTGVTTLQNDLLFSADAAHSIGADGASRPLDVFVARDGIYGRDLEVVRNLFVDGGQIAFPATQVPSAGANTLDDYEEGSWTPSLGGSATYTGRSAAYIKIGRMVIAWCDMTVNAIGTGSATTISGLPFTADRRGVGDVARISGAAVAAVSWRCYADSATVIFEALTAASTSSASANTFASGTAIDFMVIFRTAD